MPANPGIQYAVSPSQGQTPRASAFTGLPAFAGNDEQAET